MSPLPAPSLLGRTKDWLRHLKQRSRSPLIRPDEKTGFFSNAHGFTINSAQIVDASGAKDIKIEYINTIVSTGQAVFELLEPYTCLDATKDSSARDPPPRCHPETRLKIRKRLTRWLLKEHGEWKMLWVRGSAGTGKSAVAQSFGDSCEEEKRHGASYFFSRTTGRNKLPTVVPTIVYQLAIIIPEYRSLIGHELANNPLLLRQSPFVQFRKLIVEPFATIQRQSPQKPIVVILDGLDECEGEDDQWSILEMITDAIRSNPDLPLRWLIFSRPEAHLKNAFSRNLLCGREELIIDAECRKNVERYVKDRLGKIKDKYSDIMPADWPLPKRLQELLDAVSGLFIFASTCLNFIADPEKDDPSSQLDSLLTFFRRSQGVGSINPLAALDLLYFRILEKIPPVVYEATRQILAYMSRESKPNGNDSAQVLCNFLRLDQHTFYKAARGLHSVMGIPEAKDAAKFRLQFYHASFQDFLLDPNRSGKFAIGQQDALAYFLPLYIYWYNVDVTNFHRNNWWYSHTHDHSSLPGLTWVSEDDRLSISRSVINVFERWRTRPTVQLDVVNESLFSQLLDIDFRYWRAYDLFYVAYVCSLSPSTSLVRREPSSPTDYQLLEYFYLMIENGVAKPATFPLREGFPEGEWIREYFFVGRGDKSVILWRTGAPNLLYRAEHSLRCDQPPCEAEISSYRTYLYEIMWDEAEARSEMK